MRLATSTLPALLKWQNKINMMLGSKITFHPSRAAFTPFLTLSRHGCHRSSFRGAGAAGPPARRPRDVGANVPRLREALHGQVQRQATRPTYAPGKDYNQKKQWEVGSQLQEMAGIPHLLLMAHYGFLRKIEFCRNH